jgi:hypothetical protein
VIRPRGHDLTALIRAAVAAAVTTDSSNAHGSLAVGFVGMEATASASPARLPLRAPLYHLNRIPCSIRSNVGSQRAVMRSVGRGGPRRNFSTWRRYQSKIPGKFPCRRPEREKTTVRSWLPASRLLAWIGWSQIAGSRDGTLEGKDQTYFNQGEPGGTCQTNLQSSLRPPEKNLGVSESDV